MVRRISFFEIHIFSSLNLWIWWQSTKSNYCDFIGTFSLPQYLLPDQFTKLLTEKEHSFSPHGHFSSAIAQPILQFQILLRLQIVIWKLQRMKVYSPQLFSSVYWLIERQKLWVHKILNVIYKHFKLNKYI
jgi:hypothetical protein